MTWPRKVSRSIQEALRVILPDYGRFPHHESRGGREMFGKFLSTGKPQSLQESIPNQIPKPYFTLLFKLFRSKLFYMIYMR